MADGSIEFNVELDAKDAEAELRRLQKEISKLEDDTKVKQAAKDRLTQQLREIEAAYKKAISAGDDETAKAMSKDYDSVAGKIEAINEKLDTNADKINAAKERAAEYMRQLETSPELPDAPGGSGAERAATAIGKRSGNLIAQWKRVNTYLTNAAGRLRVFSALTTRLGSIMSRVGKLAAGAFVFSQLTRGFSAMRTSMEEMLQTNTNLMMAMTRFKGAVRAMIEPIYSAVVPALTAMLNLLTRVVTALGTFTATIFGKTATEAQANAKALEEQADATEATGKAAKDASKPLASFDEINKLDNGGSSGGGGSAAAALAGTEATGGVIGSWGEMLSGFLDKLIAKLPQLDAALQRAAESFNDFARKAAAALTFPGLADQVAVLGMGIADALNHMIATIDWGALGTALGAGFNLALMGLVSFIYGFDWIALGAAVADILNKAIEQMDWQNVGRLLWAKFKISIEFLAGLLQSLDMAALAKAASDIAIGFVDGISETLEKIDWEQLGRQTAALIANIKWGEVTAALFRALGTALAGLALFLRGLIEDAWNDVVDWWRDVAYEDGQFTIEGLLDGIAWKMDGIFRWLETYVVDPFVNGFKQLFGINSPSTVMYEQGVFLMEGLLGGIRERWSEIQTTLTAAWATIRDGAAAAFEQVRQKVQDAWSRMWSGVKGTLNSMLSGVESWINGIIRGINRLLEAVSSVAGAVGGLLGFKAPNLSISEVRLPRLAQGAVIPPNREFLAVLGDQSSGRNIEAPEALLRQMAQDAASANTGMLQRIIQLMESGRVLVVDDTVAAELTYKLNHQASNIHGGSLVSVRAGG